MDKFYYYLFVFGEHIFCSLMRSLLSGTPVLTWMFCLIRWLRVGLLFKRNFHKNIDV